jgi:hypothetical protein
MYVERTKYYSFNVNIEDYREKYEGKLKSKGTFKNTLIINVEMRNYFYFST